MGFLLNFRHILSALYPSSLTQSGQRAGKSDVDFNVYESMVELISWQTQQLTEPKPNPRASNGRNDNRNMNGPSSFPTTAATFSLERASTTWPRKPERRSFLMRESNQCYEPHEIRITETHLKHFHSEESLVSLVLNWEYVEELTNCIPHNKT